MPKETADGGQCGRLRRKVECGRSQCRRWGFYCTSDEAWCHTGPRDGAGELLRVLKSEFIVSFWSVWSKLDTASKVKSYLPIPQLRWVGGSSLFNFLSWVLTLLYWVQGKQSLKREASGRNASAVVKPSSKKSEGWQLHWHRYKYRYRSIRIQIQSDKVQIEIHLWLGWELSCRGAVSFYSWQP